MAAAGVWTHAVGAAAAKTGPNANKGPTSMLTLASKPHLCSSPVLNTQQHNPHPISTASQADKVSVDTVTEPLGGGGEGGGD